MKKFKVLLLCLVALVTMPAAAQMSVPQLPADTAVRIGKLPNGLTYYVRHNALPANRANFYIAQKVGSVQEEDSQRGLAHFLEHMCFNGTDHFPGNTLTKYCENIGVMFGQDLNAYTSTDETVYNIDNVPVTPSNVDSCLLILRDWADGLTLAPTEIDKERRNPRRMAPTLFGHNAHLRTQLADALSGLPLCLPLPNRNDGGD